MSKEFNQYIIQTGDLPWWHTENSLVGFLSTGLTRNNQATVILEYQCSKGKCGWKYGRADAWVKYFKTDCRYLIEAKSEYVSAWTKKSWEELASSINAENQVLSYAANQNDIDSPMTLCFKVLYCKSDIQSAKTAWSFLLKDKGGGWYARKESKICGDFSGLIHFKDLNIAKGFIDNCEYIYPAIFICGRFH
jgi:hypothetical protein